MKLFEIPVYALSKDMLMKRYEEKRKHLVEKWDLMGTQNGDEKRIKEIIYLVTYPQYLWDYNHIVGFINIKYNSRDIAFEQFVPAKPIERYRWDNRKQKMFLMNNGLNGYHFYYRGMRTGKDIQDRIHLMLDDITNRIKKEKHYYVDREAFDQADRLIDYSKLLEE